jgi:thiamine biosynthesis lipoprotein
MLKTSIDLARHVFGGRTMGTEWSVTLDASLSGRDLGCLQNDLQTAVDLVDRQMSTWNAASDLMRLNAAPCHEWLPQPPELIGVLADGLAISAATGGAFEMNLGDVVRAWGFVDDAISLDAIRAASRAPRLPAIALLDLDIAGGLVRKRGPVALDLSGIAKGYGVDCLIGVLQLHSIAHGLCAIDGELRAIGPQASGAAWRVSVETPDDAARAAHSMVNLTDGALATSGDYRHFVTVKGKRLSHSIDPKRGAPCIDAPASVTVLAARCVQADALATALLVMGAEAGIIYARANNLNALFLLRKENELLSLCSGSFEGQ